MVKTYKSPVYADPTAFNLCPSNSSRPVRYAQNKEVNFDKNASFYDMSGDKFMVILNQRRFKNTKHFKLQPSMRSGTSSDVRRLKNVFHKLGFLMIVLRDLEYKEIINFLTVFAGLDHSMTSCVCVTILTHGDKGGQIFAADRPYLLSEVMAIFGNNTSFTNKPKLFFVQACRGNRMDPGHTVHVGVQSDSIQSTPSNNSSELRVSYSASEEKVFLTNSAQPEQDEAANSGWLCFSSLYKACRGNRMNPGHTVHVGVQSDSIQSTPSNYSSELRVSYSASEEKVFLTNSAQPEQDEAANSGWPFFSSLYKVYRQLSGLVNLRAQDFRDFWMKTGDTDGTCSDGRNVSILTVPSHADTLVMCSTVEDYLSYRDRHGSWLMQTLCDTIEKNREDLNLVDMIILMNRKVAYEKTTHHCKYWEMNNKKQMPETRFTLTKQLKFQTELCEGACPVCYPSPSPLS